MKKAIKWPVAAAGALLVAIAAYVAVNSGDWAVRLHARNDGVAGRGVRGRAGLGQKRRALRPSRIHAQGRCNGGDRPRKTLIFRRFIGSVPKFRKR